MTVLLKLLVLFGGLSLLAFGGGAGVLPAIQHSSVDVEHWLSAREFIDLFAISRAAPGPSSTIVLLVGLKAAGFTGALVAGLAMFGPSMALVYVAARFWRRLETASWRRTAEAALAPVAVGLVFASGLSLVQGTEHGWLLWGITLISTVVLTLTEWHPAVMLAAGGLLSFLAS